MSDERKIPAVEDFDDIGKRLAELREEKERLRRIDAIPDIVTQDVESALSVPGIWATVSEDDYPGIFG